MACINAGTRFSMEPTSSQDKRFGDNPKTEIFGDDKSPQGGVAQKRPWCKAAFCGIRIGETRAGGSRGEILCCFNLETFLPKTLFISLGA